jgi:hypothetical protein
MKTAEEKREVEVLRDEITEYVQSKLMELLQALVGVANKKIEGGWKPQHPEEPAVEPILGVLHFTEKGLTMAAPPAPKEGWRAYYSQWEQIIQVGVNQLDGVGYYIISESFILVVDAEADLDCIGGERRKRISELEDEEIPVGGHKEEIIIMLYGDFMGKSLWASSRKEPDGLFGPVETREIGKVSSRFTPIYRLSDDDPQA